MNLNIQTNSLRLSRSIKSYVQNRVNTSLRRRGDKIRRVDVRLSDINGPHGGVDKRCQIHLVLPHQSDIVIKDTQENIYRAIDRAIGRCRSVLDRKLSRFNRRRQKSRQDYRQFADLVGEY